MVVRVELVTIATRARVSTDCIRAHLRTFGIGVTLVHVNARDVVVAKAVSRVASTFKASIVVMATLLTTTVAGLTFVYV